MKPAKMKGEEITLYKDQMKVSMVRLNTDSNIPQYTEISGNPLHLESSQMPWTQTRTVPIDGSGWS